MALFNYAAREISAKIVYYGPGLSGKTTNIESIYSMLQSDQRGKLISLPTETDRTLFFDFLPVELGEIKGFTVRFHLYTVPGQVFYNQTRKLVLQGVDGIVFVADSQVNMLESDLESLDNLKENLASYGKKLEDTPFVLQYNKQDLKNIMTVDQMNAELNKNKVPYFQAIAITGEGVKETLMEIAKMVFNHLRRTLLLESELGTLQEEEIGEIVGREMDEKFVREEEEIQEIEDLEELPGDSMLSVDFGELSTDGPLGGEIQEMHDGSSAVDELLEEMEEASLTGDFTGGGEAEAIDVLEEIEIEEEVEEKEDTFEGIDEGAGAVDEAPDPGEVAIQDVGVSVEGEGLSFARMEEPFISLDGEAVIPAVFYDREGNEVVVKIKVSVDKG